MALADQHFWDRTTAIDQDQRRGIPGTELGMVISFLLIVNLRLFVLRNIRHVLTQTAFVYFAYTGGIPSGGLSSNPCIRRAHCNPTTAPLTGWSNPSEAKNVKGK